VLSVGQPGQVDLISDALPFAGYERPKGKHTSFDGCHFMCFQQRRRSHVAVIRVCDDAGNLLERHEHKGDSKEW
jgi:hypothetical protein